MTFILVSYQLSRIIQHNTERHSKPVDSKFIEKQIDKWHVKKATGAGGISSKLIKTAKPTISASHISLMINNSFSTSIFSDSTFPDSLKVAQVP